MGLCPYTRFLGPWRFLGAEMKLSLWRSDAYRFYLINDIKDNAIDARFPVKDKEGLPNREIMEGRWGPWVKTSKELGLIGPKSQNDKKAYNKYIKAGFQKY